jgi:hypothetical protein
MRRILPFLLLIPSLASAARPELVCPLVGDGAMQIDGLLDDWESMRSLTKAGPDARSSAVAVRCAYDATTLYVSVDVTDERLVRVRGGASDGLILGFGDARLHVLPASDSARLEVAWEKTRATPRLPKVADSLQKRGWSIELSLPLAAVPGWGKGAPQVRFAVTHQDADQSTGSSAAAGAATGEFLLTFEAASRTLKSFLDELHLRPADVSFDSLADVDGAPGPERVIVAGKILAALGEGYAYVGLPVESPRDLLGVELADLAGAGTSAVIVRYRERGGGGSRDVLAVFVLRHDGFARLFAHEIAKQLGNARLENRWELRRAPKGAKGRELVITPGAVNGFTAESWNETPAEDMAPILLPWGEKKQEVWRFDKDGVSGG